MADIPEEKSQHSGVEGDDELTDDGHKKRRKKQGNDQPSAEKNSTLLTMEERKFAQQRPYSSFVRRPTTASKLHIMSFTGNSF